MELFDRDLDREGSLLQLFEDLTRAVGDGGLEVHYQPQMNLRTREVRSLEALLRWHHPQLGPVSPLTFLPMAEHAGLMPAITAWVLDQALSQCAHWRNADGQVTVSVNISVSDLIDPQLATLVADALHRHRLPGDALVLEITETSVITNYERCKQTIEALRRLGLAVSVDDFGAGFTSLAYLGDLAVGELKLDRSFITGLADTTNLRDRELVRSTISLGHALGLRVVAEGIEDGHTLEVLTGLGCDYAQGYFISRPVPADRIELPAPQPLRAHLTGDGAPTYRRRASTTS